MKHRLSFQQIMTISICISLAFTFVSAPVSAAPILPALPAVVKIGVIYPYTGPLAPWGQEGGPFLNQAEADINSLSGTVKFHLVRRTSDGTPAGALAAAQNLVDVEGVQAIVGLPTSPELAGAIAFLTAKNVAVISSTSTGTAPSLRQPDQIYRIMPNELYLARNMAKLVVNQGFTNVAVIYSNNGWGTDYANELLTQLAVLGCTTQSVAISLLPPSAGTYFPEVQDLATKVDALGPDSAVVMVVPEGDDLIILNQASHFPNLYVPWFSAMAGPQLLTGMHAGLNLPDGSIFAEAVDLWSQEYYFPRGGLADALLLQAQTSLGRKAAAEHVYLYDAIQLMAQAILRAGTYNGPSIAYQIPIAASSYPAATGSFFFDPNGDRDAGDLAYIRMLPGGSAYEYHYCAFFYGNSFGGTFNILLGSQPRDLEWLR